MKTDLVVETGKSVPAVGASFYAAITLNETVAIATLFYVLLQAAYLIWKWHKEATGKNNGKE